MVVVFSVNELNKCVFLFDFGMNFALFGDQGFESVFYGVFIPSIFEEFGYFRPFFALVEDVANKSEILPEVPFLF